MNIKTTSDLTSKIYFDSLNIRETVFVKEQGVPKELEIDEYENISKYYVGYLADQPVVTARTYITDDGGWHIQRVATDKNFRHRNLASQLLTFIENDAQKQNIKYLILSAQDQAQAFYLKLGYHVEGEQFLDAGIKHHNMRKLL